MQLLDGVACSNGPAYRAFERSVQLPL